MVLRCVEHSGAAVSIVIRRMASVFLPFLFRPGIFLSSLCFHVHFGCLLRSVEWGWQERAVWEVVALGLGWRDGGSNACMDGSVVVTYYL